MRLSFNGRTVLDSVDLTLKTGSVILLRGPNGAGKTCLIDMLTAVLEPTGGTLRFRHDRRVASMRFPSPAWRRWFRIRQSRPEVFARLGIGRSWQDSRLFESLSVEGNLTVASRSHAGEALWGLLTGPHRARRDEAEALQRARQLVADLELDHVADSLACHVSFGQGRRLAIGRTLAFEPSVVFLDEPLAGLDAAGAREVIALIRRLAASERVAIVIVEHTFNVPWLIDLATEVWTIRDQRVVVESPAQLRRDHAQSSWTGLPSWAEWIVGRDVSEVERQFADRATLHVVRKEDAIEGEPALSVDDLVVRRGGRIVVGSGTDSTDTHGVAFNLRKGELGILTAPNGWGKTTLVEGIAGMAPADGKILIEGVDLTSLPTWKRARAGLALLRADGNAFEGLSVRQALQVSGVATPSLLDNALLSRRVGSLSGGERQILAIETALGGTESHFAVAILDEPFQGLDESMVRRVCDRLRNLLSTAAILITMPRPLGGPEIGTFGEIEA